MNRIAFCALVALALAPAAVLADGVDDLVKAKKVIRQVVTNGDEMSVHYVPVQTLTPAERLVVATAEAPPSRDLPDALMPGEKALLVIRAAGGVREQVVGVPLGRDGDWQIVRTDTGFAFVRPADILQIVVPPTK